MKNFFYDRLWVNNSSLVQLLGLCPVLAITNNVVNAIGLGITTTVVLTCTNTIISLFKKWIPKDIRIPIYMVIISSLVSSIEMLIHSYYFNLYKSLGIFIPLIVTNCIVLGRADFIAYRSSVLVSFFDGIFIGLGSTLAMFCVSAVREILSNGTLFYGFNKLCFVCDNSFVLTIIDKSFSMLLFTLPPGGFMILGFVIAFKNFIDIYFNDYILSNFSICSCVKFKKKY